MQGRKYILVFNLVLSLLVTSSSWAGSQQGGEPQFSIEQIATLTKKVEKTMAAKGVRIFIIGRNGRPVEDLPRGVKYTHVAFGVYSKIKTDSFLYFSENIIGNLINSSFYSTLDIRPGYLSEGKYNTG